MYGAGYGVVQDYVRADMWFNLAVASPHAADAVKFRDLIEARMTQQQIAQAQRMERECKQRNFKGCD
jgi:hypothetical protein